MYYCCNVNRQYIVNRSRASDVSHQAGFYSVQSIEFEPSPDSSPCPSMYLHPRTNGSALCPPACGPGLVVSDRTPGETQDETGQQQIQDPPPDQFQHAAAGQQFGKRTYAGIAILAIVVVLGLVIYGVFGKWPRATLKKWKKERQARKHPPRRMKSRGVQTVGDEPEVKEEKVRGDADVEQPETASEQEWWTKSPVSATTEKSPRLSLALDSPSLPLWTEKRGSAILEAESTEAFGDGSAIEQESIHSSVKSRD
ncbi:hypothetical protein NEOLEDRAFT_9420 [Neolentinus lepideus HHB14362 ss-1]|uniref:Transmembrane protein n=1 Tax=Neolentinus lepideus HHB14362 ss-1 TaxID=1314782 RepID=A0A165VZK9_9AGAM|nr:hypothetical protein NEOLEDRAFT_9420 [Neolentinus lepideus HHB14362 ss-1]